MQQFYDLTPQQEPAIADMEPCELRVLIAEHEIPKAGDLTALLGGGIATLAAVDLAGPLAFLMELPFPDGLALVPWVWGVSGFRGRAHWPMVADVQDRYFRSG